MIKEGDADTDDESSEPDDDKKLFCFASVPVDGISYRVKDV